MLGAAACADAILAVFAAIILRHQDQLTMATATKAKKKTVRIASGLSAPPGRQAQRRQHGAALASSAPSIKNVQKAVDAGDKAKAAELFKTAQPVIDSVADKGLFHKNKAARHKSRLAAKVKALATAA